MRAIQVQQTGAAEVLQSVELPRPQPNAGEVLVKIAASGVNFIDIYLRQGHYPAPLPFVDGQEAAGTIVETGAGVKDFKSGDRVAYAGVLGSYAEYAVVPTARLVRVPDDVDDRSAAAAMLQGLTAHYLIHSTYPLQAGETALIHAAAGGTGLLLVQMAHARGGRVIATAGSQEKAQLALQAGADEVIVYTEADFEAETKRLTAGQGVHVVYDGVGKTTFEKDLNVLRRRGMLVLFGGASGPVPPFNPLILTQKGSLYLTRPSLSDYIAQREELEARSAELFGMIGSGRIKLRLGQIYKLEQAAVAHRELEGRKTTGKLLLEP